MTTPTPPLSPAAQYAWNTWNDAYEAQGLLEDMGCPLAAALIAAADQVTPEEALLTRRQIKNVVYAKLYQQRQQIRSKLLAIAAELRQEGRA
jgi:hypothetical protein